MIFYRVEDLVASLKISKIKVKCFKSGEINCWGQHTI